MGWLSIHKFIVQYCDEDIFDHNQFLRCIQIEGVNNDSDSPSPLHFCTVGSNISMMEILLTNNADVNAVDKKGAKPIHWACFKGNLSHIQLLLQYNSDIHSVDYCKYIFIFFY